MVYRVDDFMDPAWTPPDTSGPPAEPPLDAYTATMIAEGVEEATEERQIEAWQYLHDTGLAYRLQGWFGRTAQDLIARGLIHE